MNFNVTIIFVKTSTLSRPHLDESGTDRMSIFNSPTDRPVKQLIDDQMSKPATNLVTGDPCVLECVKPFGMVRKWSTTFRVLKMSVLSFETLSKFASLVFWTNFRNLKARLCHQPANKFTDRLTSLCRTGQPTR